MAELKFEKPVDLDEVRGHLEAAGYDGALVQSFGSESDIVVRLQPQEGQANAEQTGGAVLDAINLPDNRGQVVSSDFVGPQVGDELAWNGLLAVVFVAVGFVIYITFRFEWKFAVSAITTTMFDVLVTTGFFAFTQREFDLPVLAGILSVMGYSINDKIVVCRPRARELPRAAQGVVGRGAESIGQPDALAHHHHVVRRVPDRAGALHLRRLVAGRHGGGADVRHRAGHACRRSSWRVRCCIGWGRASRT